MGQFALFTYLRPFLETVTQVNVSTLSLMLLVIGVAGFIGTTVIGRLLTRSALPAPDHHPARDGRDRRGADRLRHLGRAVSRAARPVGAAVGTAAPVGWWSWIARRCPRNAEAGGGLMVAVVQLAIALGSTVGGLLFDASGYAAPLASVHFS